MEKTQKKTNCPPFSFTTKDVEKAVWDSRSDSASPAPKWVVVLHGSGSGHDPLQSVGR